MSENWKPNFNFEDEMLDIQPDCDLIFRNYDRNPDSMAMETLKDEINGICKNFVDYNENCRKIPEESKELFIVSKVREMIPTKNFVGRRLTEDDLLDEADRETETIAMIRNVGSAPCVDVPLASSNTLPVINPKKGFKISNGHPILFDPEYFKLKPRSSSSNTSTTSSSTSNNSSISTNSSLDVGYKALSSSISENVQNKSHCDVANSNSPLILENLTLSQSPSVPQKVENNEEIKKKSKEEINKNLVESVKNMKSKLENNNINFITPKELYRKKRAMKS